MVYFQRRSQKFAKEGAYQQKNVLALANSFLALYPPPDIFCPRGLPPLATPLSIPRLDYDIKLS
jgi:hypothetical protein